MAGPLFDLSALAKYYETLTDAELLTLRSEGGLREEAKPVLSNEIKRRDLEETNLQQHKIPARILLREEAKEKGFGGKGLSLLFFGRHYLDQNDKDANIQLRTKWFALGGIPLIPLASYRFKCTGDPDKWFHWDAEQRVVNRVPLNWTQVFLTWMKTAIIIVGAGLVLAGFLLYRQWQRH